jgi:hypothetical protein
MHLRNSQRETISLNGYNLWLRVHSLLFLECFSTLDWLERGSINKIIDLEHVWEIKILKASFLSSSNTHPNRPLILHFYLLGECALAPKNKGV